MFQHLYLRTMPGGHAHPNQVAWLLTAAADQQLVDRPQLWAGYVPIQDDEYATPGVILGEAERAFQTWWMAQGGAQASLF